MTVHINSQTNIAESEVLQTDSPLTYQEQNGDMITKCQPSPHGNVLGKKPLIFQTFFPTMHIKNITNEIKIIAVSLFK